MPLAFSDQNASSRESVRLAARPRLRQQFASGHLVVLTALGDLMLTSGRATFMPCRAGNQGHWQSLKGAANGP